MAIETICSGCAKKLRVSDEHAGKQARCPECGTIYTVPQVVDSPRSSFDEAPREEPLSARSLGSLGTPAFANPPAKEPQPERWLMKIDDGREFGPVERLVLDQWFAERRIGPSTRLKRETDVEWQPARNLFPSLSVVTTSAPVENRNPFADQPTYGAFSPTGGMAAVASYQEAHRGGLILALALIGWFVGCFFLGIAAWVMASGDLAKMRAGQMDPSGEGLTRAGQIIGILHTVFSIFIILGLIALMVVGVAAGN